MIFFIIIINYVLCSTMQFHAIKIIPVTTFLFFCIEEIEKSDERQRERERDRYRETETETERDR